MTPYKYYSIMENCIIFVSDAMMKCRIRYKYIKVVVNKQIFRNEQSV